MKKKSAPIFISLILLCALIPNICQAHRVNIFAWSDGTLIHVQGGFSKSQPARKAEITVLDGQSGETITTGRTSDTGEWSFPIPTTAAKNGLVLRINAGEGHVNSWKMECSEFVGQDSEVAKDEASLESDAADASTPALGDMRAMVREEVRAALAPLYKKMTEDDTPKLKDIVGGTGWIIGIFALIYLSRRGVKVRRDESER